MSSQLELDSVSPIDAPADRHHGPPQTPQEQQLQRSRSRLAISKLNSIRRDRRPAHNNTQQEHSRWGEARPDSATLNDPPRIMVPPVRAHTVTPTNLNVRTPLSTISSQTSASVAISPPIGPPFYPTAEQYGGYGTNPSYAANKDMYHEAPYQRPHWLSSLRSVLRILILILSGATAGLLIHTLHIYRGNRYLDLRNHESPMLWPAKTNLVPTLTLLSVAVANFLASIAILLLAFKKSFRRPLRSRDVNRLIVGYFAIIIWVAALPTFAVVDSMKMSALGHYSCAHKDVLSNGRFQYRMVCEEQFAAFYLATGASAAECITLITLALSAARQARQPACPQEKPIMSGADGGHWS